uniref:Uncharacterized protein n=1 Tax=Arundo donax TaxID=35708 RepID=A0A0A9A8W8_ARUDO
MLRFLFHFVMCPFCCLVPCSLFDIDSFIYAFHYYDM